MKTYKGYNKIPYCVTHYPTTRFTAVVDTPENKRLAKQQQNQSDLLYRKDKKSALEGFTQVADSVSTRQAAHSAKLASNLLYQTAPHQVGREGKEVGDIVNRKSEEDSRNDVPIMTSLAEMQISDPPETQEDTVATTEERFVAMYDYTAADDDEVSFVEGDIITDGVQIDEGWMEGRVERTGQYGMLPSNYVEKI